MEKRFYMKDESSFGDYPAYVKQSSGKPRLLAIFIAVFVLVIGAMVVLYFLGAQSKVSKRVSPLPTQMPKPSLSRESNASPSAIPSDNSKLKTENEPKLDRSKLHVAILNGSGIAGAAKSTSSHLNSLGYTIAKIGNADDFSYKNMTIKIKKSKSEYLPILKKDVQENAKDVTIVTNVDDSISAEAEVIVGK